VKVITLKFGCQQHPFIRSSLQHPFTHLSQQHAFIVSRTLEFGCEREMVWLWVTLRNTRGVTRRGVTWRHMGPSGTAPIYAHTGEKLISTIRLVTQRHLRLLLTQASNILLFAQAYSILSFT
jgi:hypothetical protein